MSKGWDARPGPSQPPTPPGTDIQVLAKGRWGTVGFFSATQDIRAGVVWSIQRDIDTVIVHFGGPITALDTELEGSGAALGPPMPGEIWVVPAGHRYRSSALGGRVHYAEMHFDRRVLEAESRKPIRQPRALAGHHDPALSQWARRLEELSRATDDLSRLASESLGRTLLLDFYCRYSSTERPKWDTRRIRFSGDERKRTEVYIEGHLGSCLRLDALAALVHMTTHEYLIAFRASFGTTPAQYIIDQRLRAH
jgi:AraC family transcriptional regulator